MILSGKYEYATPPIKSHCYPYPFHVEKVDKLDLRDLSMRQSIRCILYVRPPRLRGLQGHGGTVGSCSARIDVLRPIP